MKTINVTFDDKEFKILNKSKGESESWHDFILRLNHTQESNNAKKEEQKGNAKG